jgi:1-acyl-sn-glycerol-3-phosphate acyltransferase
MTQAATQRRLPAPIASLRAAAKVVAILLASAVAMPVQWLTLRVLGGRMPFALPRFWHACLRRALSVRVELVGTPRNAPRTLYVGNHVSHFDIPLLGSLLDARFIAKDDMEGWPAMRWIGALGGTLFISRRRADAARVAAQVADAMQQGHGLVLFAEGTTSSGASVAPFKSTLLALFTRTGHDWTLQPFTIDVRSFDGEPLAAGGDRNGYAFHGDMQAGAHVRRFLRSGGACVRVVFHAPMELPPDADRKVLAAQAHAVVASGLAGAQATPGEG